MSRSIEEVKAAINPKPQSAWEPVIVRMSDVEPEELAYLWEPYVLRRKLNTMAGDAGLGKTYLTHAIAAARSNGHALPGEPVFGTGRLVRPPASVVLMSAEDG